MHTKQQQATFLLVLLIGVLVLSFFILRPFLYTLILAVIFAALFRPFHQNILALTPKSEGFAAFFTTILIVVFILTPLIFLGTQIFQQSQELYFSLTESGGRGALTKLLENSIEHLQKLFPPLGEFSINVDQYLKQGLSWLLQNLGGFFSNFAKLLTSAFIFLISLYYLLKDSSKLRKAVTALSPLADTDDEIILKKLKLAVDSVVRGNITIALIQGALTALGFTLFGVPNAILWGTVTAIAAIIPGIGTALVLIPAIVFLFLSGNTFSAFGLLLWGILAVGLIDNFLGPKLVGRGMQLHPLIVFLSVLGGLIFFGPLGFLLGPLTLSLCFVVLDIYLPRRGHES